jgi:hypothetical protein
MMKRSCYMYVLPVLLNGWALFVLKEMIPIDVNPAPNLQRAAEE